MIQLSLYQCFNALSFMKKLIIIGLLLMCFQSMFGQKVKHRSYTTYYNNGKMGPDSVSWSLTPSMVSCDRPERHDKFAKDPQVTNCAKPSDYNSTGWEQGHLFNWDDAACNATDITECFYMSNMLPQAPSFNKGDWKTLENNERKWAANGAIRIVAGGLSSTGHLLKGENIPAFFWKAIYMNHQWFGWVMPNKNSSHGHEVNFWKYSNWNQFMIDTHFKPGSIGI